MMKTLPLSLLLAPLLALQPAGSPAARAAERPAAERLAESREIYRGMDVGATLLKLADRMYCIGELSGDLVAWDAAVGGAAGHIADRMRDGKRRAELLAPVSGEMAPLDFACIQGYPQVAETLLGFEEVRRRVDAPGAEGLTPWEWATLGRNLNLMVINPTIFADSFRWVPYLVKTPYYMDEKYAPYQRVRAALGKAGARTGEVGLRKYLEGSKVFPERLKARVLAAEDLFAALRDLTLHDEEFGIPAMARKRK